MKTIKKELISKVVRLGQLIRQHRAQGNLQSVPPPTIYGYLAFLRMAAILPHLSTQQLINATLLGNASMEDRKFATGVFNEVFGIQAEQDDHSAFVGNLF